jgi:putative molybdopterin biosynthesis protein
MGDQEQFLHVLDRDEAERRFRAVLDLTPRGSDTVPLDAALGRVLAADVISPVDVPSFDRSNVDGFAVVSEDTFGASEEVPRTVELGEETIHTGIVPTTVIRPGSARGHCHGGMVPRGADAVVMVEYAETNGRGCGRQSHHTGKRRVFRRNDITSGETGCARSAPDQP